MLEAKLNYLCGKFRNSEKSKRAMSKSTLILIILLSGIAVLLGWNYVKKPFQAAQDIGDEAVVVMASPSPEIDQNKIRLDSMSASQKIATVMAVPFVVTNSASGSATGYQDWITQYQPGSVILFGSQISLEAATAAVEKVESAYDPAQPPLLAVDHEGGTVQRLSGEGFTRLPSWQAQCSSSIETATSLLETSAQELQQLGIDIVLAPVVDVATQSAVLRTRVCDSDPAVVVERSVGFIQVMQNQGLLPVLKHFPGIGQVTKDLHLAFDRVTISPEDALLYKFILDRYPSLAVMTAPVGVLNQYPDIPCSLSLDCVKELRSNYPKALVMSDSLEMKATAFDAETGSPAQLDEISVRAIKAGNQMLLYGQSVSPVQLTQVLDRLVSEYEGDSAFAAQVDESIIRVWEVK